jgi:hypothetical protein
LKPFPNRFHGNGNSETRNRDGGDETKRSLPSSGGSETFPNSFT